MDKGLFSDARIGRFQINGNMKELNKWIKNEVIKLNSVVVAVLSGWGKWVHCCFVTLCLCSRCRTTSSFEWIVCSLNFTFSSIFQLAVLFFFTAHIVIVLISFTALISEVFSHSRQTRKLWQTQSAPPTQHQTAATNSPTNWWMYRVNHLAAGEPSFRMRAEEETLRLHLQRQKHSFTGLILLLCLLDM